MDETKITTVKLGASMSMALIALEAMFKVYHGHNRVLRNGPIAIEAGPIEDVGGSDQRLVHMNGSTSLPGVIGLADEAQWSLEAAVVMRRPLKQGNWEPEYGELAVGQSSPTAFKFAFPPARFDGVADPRGCFVAITARIAPHLIKGFGF